MKPILNIALFFFFATNVYAQDDTLEFDIESVALNMNKCEKYLFGNFRRLVSPALNLWTTSDSAFICNSDTIYVKIRQEGKVVIECAKLPSSEVFGEVKFYNSKSEITLIEVWDNQPYLEHGNANVSWGDGRCWITRKVYRKGQLFKEIKRSIIYDDQKGFARRTEINYFKNGVKKRTRLRNQYFLSAYYGK